MKRGRLIAILILLSLGLVVVLWNQSRPVPDITDGVHSARWQRSFTHRTPSFADPLASNDMHLNARGIDALGTLIVESSPVRNPIRILWEHLRYWANSRSYPMQLWIRNEQNEGEWTAYYQHGRVVFLRQANPWRNIVLIGDRTYEEVESMLHPFVDADERIDPNAPAEAEPPNTPNPERG